MLFAVESNLRFNKGAIQVRLLHAAIEAGATRSARCKQRRRAESAYFAHCENFLVAMLTDRDSAVRDQAVTKILAERKRKACELRAFRVPRLNWQAKHRTDMFSCCGQVTKPPVSKLMSENEVTGARDQPLELPSFPCHPLSMERFVKLVTEVCQNACVYENRYAQLVSRHAARKGRKRSNTKAGYRM